MSIRSVSDTHLPRPPRIVRHRTAVASLGAALLVVSAAGGVSTTSAAATPPSAAVPIASPGHGVRVIRDEHGVPHVYADTARGLFYGDGWVTAQERLWQADLVRSTATGTLAALLGPGDGDANIGSDEFFRQYTGGTAHQSALFAQLDAPSRAAITAFDAGINAEISQAEHDGTLPVEYAATGTMPRLWTAEDTLATGALSAFEVGAQGSDEANNDQVRADLTARLGDAGGAAAFSDTHWLTDPSAPTTIPGRRSSADAIAAPAATQPGTARTVSATASSTTPDRVDRTVEERVSAMLAAVKRQSKALGFGGPGHSNAIAVSGQLTASGQPLLLGGPQQGYTLPQAFMELGLHGAGYDATGVTLPGIIGVQIGAGHDSAWTVTSGGDDNEDLYVETLDPVNHPGSYLFNGHWQPYACRTETITVAGGTAVDFPACDSVHGPVLGSSGTTAIALRDATRDGYGATLHAFLGIEQARTVHQFLDAAKQAGTSLNFLYADTAGHIAYTHVGPVPIRPATDNRFLPHPGDGTDEWLGFLTARDLPTVIDPAQGWLSNWNTKPQQDWTSSTDGFWQWGPVQRVQILNRQLARIAPHTATIATLERINRTAAQTSESPVGDPASVVVQELLTPMLTALDTSADPRIAAVKAQLRTWNQQRVDTNNDGTYDDPAVTIFDAWYTALVNESLVPTLGDSYLLTGRVENVDANLVSRLLAGPRASLPLSYDYLHGSSPRDVVTHSLITALDGLSSSYGTSDPRHWLTPDITTTWYPYGAGNVADTPWMNRGTYNQILSLDKSGPRGENVVAPGESGDLRSPYFADQLTLYATWAYKPMRLTRTDVLAHATSTDVLTP
jgi:penicillin amidase